MRNQPGSSNNRHLAAARSAVIADGSFRPELAPRLDQQSVLAAYSRWAPIYDFVFAKLFFFGAFFDMSRKRAITHINTRTGTLLEVGVGTGVALSRYAPHLAVTGIDLSPDMLALARKRAVKEHLSHVRDLKEMDAAHLEFADDSFDTVAVMYTITVVPHPDLVLEEIARVLKPGGEAIFVSHFASDEPWRKAIETAITPRTEQLGWRPDFPVSRILGHPRLDLVEIRRMPPLGVFSIVRLKKTEEAQAAA
ncbi:MAG: methyltransferase domain-containing protein [Ancalomicrobiaceae bacterium]|nr:methyltransferase domain-containing protein [Ancalomicrobiaceae bacterium]